MVTTNRAEKEKELRKHLRIKEVVEKNGRSIFYPQMQKFGIWFDFPDTMNLLSILFLEYNSKVCYSLDNAKRVIDEYIINKLNKKKIIYHDVNYLTS